MCENNEISRNEVVIKNIEEKKICKCCGEEKPVGEFNKSGKNKNGKQLYSTHCKVCRWFNTKKNLIIKEKWTLNEYRIIIDNLLNERVDCINSIIDKLDSKNIKDLIELLQNELLLKGIKVQVKYRCNVCGNENMTNLHQYTKHKNHFCSKECYDIFQNKSIKKNCDNCGIEIQVPPRILKSNKHFFCSQKCDKEYKNKNYIKKEECWETLVCEGCGEEFQVLRGELNKRYRKFCNEDCFKEHQKKNYVAYKCDNCEKENKIRKSKYRNEAKLHFCNNECKHQYRKKQSQLKIKKYNCDHCGLECESTEYKYNSHKNHFCSRECKDLFQRNDFNCKEGYSICNECSEEKPFEDFLIQKRRNGTNSYLTCRVCAYLKRNKDITLHTGWTLDEYKIILDNLLNRRVKYVNELVNLLEDKSLDDIALILRDYLKIATTPINFRETCPNCNKNIKIKLHQYFNDQLNFCSAKCNTQYYGRIKSENAPMYKRICQYKECSKVFYVDTSRTSAGKDKYCCPECSQKSQINKVKAICDSCNSEYETTPSKYNKGKHHFCCDRCARKYFAEVIMQSAERRQISRITAIKNLTTGKIKSTNTSIQLKINDLLDNLGIEYINEYALGTFYTIDNYIEKYQLPIEINGTFWHSDPRFYKEINYKNNYNAIGRDKAKHTYVKNKYNIEILYLWEYEINNDFELCRKLILEYIKNDGLLENYHSFNYSLNKEGELELNRDIIIPYMYLDKSQLNKLLNIKNNIKE